MGRTTGIALFCLIALASTNALAEAPIWVVQRGDALSLIAERFEVTVEQLKSWNQLDTDLIRVGQKLVVGARLEAGDEAGDETEAGAGAEAGVEAGDGTQAGDGAETETETQAGDEAGDEAGDGAETETETQALGRLESAPAMSAATDDEIDWTPPFDYLEASQPGKEVREASLAIAAADPTIAAPRPEKEPSDPQPGKQPESAAPRTYRVQPGDTLTEIAQRFDTDIAELVATNPGLDPDRIYPGDTLEIGAPKPEVVLAWERGDTLLAVASRYDVKVRDLLRWNPGLSSRGPSPGTDVRLFTRVPVSPSEAVGYPNRGRLRDGVRLPRHRGYVMRDRERAYGTEETARWITDAFDYVAKEYPTKRVRIHDLSKRKGGWIRDHRSHQTGRDADISYYQRSCGNRGCPFEKVKPSNLDVPRQWALLEYWLRHGQAELIFIDYRLQAKLYRYAKRSGATKEQLLRWFQYPRNRHAPYGVIRHYRNHQDHLHVRFVCPYSDAKCR